MTIPGPSPEQSAAWRARAEDTFALLVGIDEYGVDATGEPIPQTPGLGRQAAAIARALIGRGVPPGHIHFLTSADPRDGDAPEGVVRGVASYDSILRQLDALTCEAGTFLWGHWAGHGFLDRDTHHLLLANCGQRYTNISRQDLLDQVNGTTYQHMYWTFDSCQLHYPGLVATRLMGRPRSGGEAGLAQHVTLVSSIPGGPAPYVTATGNSPLASAVVALLDEGAAGGDGVWPPAPEAFRDELPKLMARVSPRSIAYRLLVSSPWWEGDHPRFGRVAPSTARTELVGWRLDRPWEACALNPSVASASEVRLDLAWTADRGPLSAIVAEPEAADLAGDLTAAEEELEAALRPAPGQGAAPPWLPAGLPRRRRWQTVDAAQAADGLADVPDGVEPGYVIRVDVGAADLAEIRRAAQAVGAWARRIDDGAGPAPVLVAVRSPLPLDAILVAQGLTAAGGLPHRPAPAPAWSVYARTRPGSGCENPPLPGPGGLDDLVAGLVAGAARRGLPRPAGLDSFEDDPDGTLRTVPADEAAPSGGGGAATAPACRIDEHAALRVVADAVGAVLDDIEARAGALPLDEADEALLCAVRDLRPGLYPELLGRYARLRSGPGWGVSLALAAQFREDLAAWLAAADDEGRGPDRRDDWPPTRFSTTPADAVVLAIAADAAARRTWPPAERLAGWRRLGTGHGVDAAVDFLRAEASGRVLRSRPESALTAATLARAGFRVAADASPCEWQDDASWIALAHSGRTSTLAAEIGRLLRADHPELALAVLGVLPLPDDTSPQVSYRVDELRRILRRCEEGAPR